VSPQYTELQLDALRELANIGSGTAGTALSSMLGHAIDISVPNALVVSFPEAVEATGPAESEVTGITLGVVGDLTATVLLLVPPADAQTMCRMLGLEPDDEYALSALGEIGNIVGTSYINALAAMTGLEMEPTPPATATDMLGAIVASVLADHAEGGDLALLLDSQLEVEGEDCSVSFVLVPDRGGVDQLLERLGMA
jgi:chemotaxis protein CheC